MTGHPSHPVVSGPPPPSRSSSPGAFMLPKTKLPTLPLTKSLFDAEHEFIAPGLQTIALLSELAIDHGKGTTLTDLDGKTYLDLNAGVSVASLGHAHPRYI